MINRLLPLFSLALLFLCSCKKEAATEEPPGTGNLIFKFKFDSTQVRLNNIGQPAAVAAGNAAQSPVMNSMSAHYIELAPGALTALGQGAILYKGEETTTGGPSAIDFSKSKFAGNGEQFISIPVKDITPGTYEWLRISLAYQNGSVFFKVDTVISGTPIVKDYTGTIAGFIGFNTYITSFKVKDSMMTVNANKEQGFWGFETLLTYGPFSVPFSTSGQAPGGATTVVNPIFNTSPVPAGSCVVTGAFAPGKLTITGKENTDIIVELSFSTNKSFEWTEINADGKWEPSKGEAIVDMGIRGMIPTIK